MITKNLRFPAFAIQLSEAKDGKPAEVSKRVQVMRTGRFSHPSYGKFSITKEHLDSMVKNFSEGARGIELAVDYNHESGKEAAAWFEKVEVQAIEKGGHALLADVDWTPPAQEKLRNKEFKYLSGDFNLSYVDAETSKNHGPTLFGAGLTNRPFIKGMDAVIQLSENPNDTGDDEMTELEKAEAARKAAQEKADNAEKQLSEVNAKLKLAEEKEQKQLAEQKLAEKKGKFDKMLTEKKVVEAQREAFMKDDFEAFTNLAQPAPKDKKLSEEEGNGNEDVPAEGDCQDKVIALAEKAVEEKKASDFNAGIKMVLADPKNKKLAEEYKALAK